MEWPQPQAPGPSNDDPTNHAFGMMTSRPRNSKSSVVRSLEPKLRPGYKKETASKRYVPPRIAAWSVAQLKKPSKLPMQLEAVEAETQRLMLPQQFLRRRSRQRATVGAEDQTKFPVNVEHGRTLGRIPRTLSTGLVSTLDALFVCSEREELAGIG